MVHPNAAVVPAALAIAESSGNVSGRDLIVAVALGSDLVCRLGIAGKRGNDGLRSFASSFGATAAVAKLLRLDHDRLIQAFSLAMFQGTFRSEAMRYGGSHMRGVREAFSAKAGVVAAQLAEGGVQAFPSPFEERCDEEALLDGLGTRFLGTGVSFKPWPSCRGTHAFVEAALSLMDTHSLTPDQLAVAEVTVSPFFESLCNPPERKRRPQTVIDAKFSIPYTLATAMKSQQVTLGSFTFDRIRDLEVLELADRIEYQVDRTVSDDQADRGSLCLRMTDGRTFSRTIEHPLGHPTKPMSMDALAEKFFSCAEYARVPLSRIAAESLSRKVSHLEELQDLSSLFDGHDETVATRR
jgi:2-methylcitrate dehydratase PrpD